MPLSQHNIDIIGAVHSPYKEKFAIPRQPGLVSEAKGRIELLAPYNSEDSVRDLEQFSHIWVLFVFHQTQQQGWKPLVRPPRLGGNARTGVFATRSTFRPNPIGMSVVRLDGISKSGKQLFMEISGLDLLDQTPVIDIKPYIPYCDSHPLASAGFAADAPTTSMNIEFDSCAQQQLDNLKGECSDLEPLIRAVLQQDPRPAYKSNNDQNQTYGMRLYDFNITWKVIGDISTVLKIDLVSK